MREHGEGEEERDSGETKPLAIAGSFALSCRISLRHDGVSEVIPIVDVVVVDGLRLHVTHCSLWLADHHPSGALPLHSIQQ